MQLNLRSAKSLCLDTSSFLGDATNVRMGGMSIAAWLWCIRLGHLSGPGASLHSLDTSLGIYVEPMSARAVVRSAFSQAFRLASPVALNSELSPALLGRPVP